MAHDDKIVQIVSLSKLKNKYFATRCVDGDVSIWSATPHPDRVFTIENVDQDETTMPIAKDQSSAEIAAQPVPEPVAEEPKEEAPAEDEEAEEEVDEDGNPIPKKKKPAPVVKKDKSGRISSDKDCMIEIKWSETVI